jgi:hypothetical protein
MPEFTNMTDREILIEMVRYRSIAERMANELMRRANEEPTHDGH